MLSAEVTGWFQRLRDFRPYNQVDLFRPEQELRVNTEELKLVAKFDLLYINKSNRRVIIYDWKTNYRASSGVNRSNQLQTIVYLYVLAQAGRPYFPGNKLTAGDLSIIYWNPRFPGKVTTVRYGKEMLSRDAAFLIRKVTEIKRLPYDQFKATTQQRTCRYCEYRPICQGERADYLELAEGELDLELDWEAIEELQF